MSRVAHPPPPTNPCTSEMLISASISYIYIYIFAVRLKSFFSLSRCFGRLVAIYLMHPYRKLSRRTLRRRRRREFNQTKCTFSQTNRIYMRALTIAENVSGKLFKRLQFFFSSPFQTRN